MNQRSSARLGGGFGDGSRAIDMNARDITAERADEIDDRIGTMDGARDRLGPSHVGGDELRLAKPTQRLQEPCVARIALCDAQARARREQCLRDIAAQKAAAADQRDQPVVHLHAVSRHPIIAAPCPAAPRLTRPATAPLDAPAYLNFMFSVPRWRNW